MAQKDRGLGGAEPAVAHRLDTSPYRDRRTLVYLLGIAIVLSGLVILGVAFYAQA
jgi:hypothetical protein